MGECIKQQPAESAIQTAFTRAVALYQRGDLEAAEKILRRLLGVARDQFGVAHLLGAVLIQRQKMEEGAHFLRQAIQINPKEAETHNNLGVVLRGLKQPKGALLSYNRAIALKPGFAEALNNCGGALYDLRRYKSAIESCRRAIAIKPDYPEAHFNRGLALYELGRLDEAIASFNRAMAIKSDYPEAFNSRGNAFGRLKRPRDALASYNKGITLKPQHAEARYNLGLTLFDLDRLDDAIVSYDQALALRPAFAEALNNRGNALRHLNKHAEALTDYNRAIILNPHYSQALNNRGILNLSLGDYSAGWKDYEHRWMKENFPSERPSVEASLWEGQDLQGRSIVIHAEQGMGDTIQFVRYLPLLQKLGADVSLIARAALHRLISTGISGVHLFADANCGRPFDYQCALMTLPLGFQTSLTNIPARVPYLAAEDELCAQWRARIGTQDFKVGICWQGNPVGIIDRGRSIPLPAFKILADIPRVRLVSLQTKHGLDQVEHLPHDMKVETLGTAFDAGPDAFIDTAAVMEGLDLIITSDTAVAHLAGALGRPVWVALQHVPDWRWMLGREDSPWYPTMRLFRQAKRGDWAGIFAQIRVELSRLAWISQT
jgi:tetratricopeptide (TPR) repeat protein